MTMSADDDKISWLAQEAAWSAGRAVIEQWGASRDHVRCKGKSDIVTTADILSDDIVAACIKAKFPSHRILSEETPAGTDSTIPALCGLSTQLTEQPTMPGGILISAFPLLSQLMALF
jgi:fructose-1,6-bisphosphatase/inositol monophosphatase family enzyme